MSWTFEQYCGSGYRIQCFFEHWFRDPGRKKIRIREKHTGWHFQELGNYLGLKYLNSYLIQCCGTSSRILWLNTSRTVLNNENQGRRECGKCSVPTGLGPWRSIFICHLNMPEMCTGISFPLSIVKNLAFFYKPVRYKIWSTGNRFLFMPNDTEEKLAKQNTALSCR